jgi:hypothetical protein
VTALDRASSRPRKAPAILPGLGWSEVTGRIVKLGYIVLALMAGPICAEVPPMFRFYDCYQGHVIMI